MNNEEFQKLVCRFMKFSLLDKKGGNPLWNDIEEVLNPKESNLETKRNERMEKKQ